MDDLKFYDQLQTNNLAFENILFLLIVACVLLLIIGFVSPKLSLFWYREERTRKKSAQVYGLFLITFIIILGLLITAWFMKFLPGSNKMAQREAEIVAVNIE